MVKGGEIPRWMTMVDALVLPADIAGHPALALLNTWAGWSATGVPAGEAAHRDYLPTYDHLAVLATDRGLLPRHWRAPLRRAARRDPARAEDALARAKEARAAAYRGLVLEARPRDLSLLARLSLQARSEQRLVGGDQPRWEFRSPTLEAPVLAAALTASDLLTSPERARVTRCPGTDCGWAFVNDSGRRRWCQMAVCGNRAKAKAFSARHG